MSALRRIAWELTRPRGHVAHPWTRARRRGQRGIALLLAITTILFATVLVSEIAFASTVRLQLAAHHRDQAKAEALAQTGVHIYRLVLSASKALGKNPMIQQFETMLGMDLGDALWQLVPFINTGLMRMLVVTEGDADGDDAERIASGGMTAEEEQASREDVGFDRNFLDFDGDFFAEVTDEDRKVLITSFTATDRVSLEQDPAAVQLYSLMSGVRTCPSEVDFGTTLSQSEEIREDLDRFFLDENIERWEAIGNLADWTDNDTVRVWDGGSEDSLYNNLERDPYLPKNAPFDTMEEVRLIPPWNDDDMWERFGPHVTVYGQGKINVNTAECDVMWALLKSYVEPEPSDDQVRRLMDAMKEQMALTSFSDGRQFVSFLQAQGVTVDNKLASMVSTESRVFRVTSTGQVGDATVTIDAVLDYSTSETGRVLYWRVR